MTSIANSRSNPEPARRFNAERAVFKSDAPALTKLVMVYLLSIAHQNSGGQILDKHQPSQRTIMARTGIGSSHTVIDALNDCRTRSWLSWTPTGRGRGRKLSINYGALPAPVSDAGKEVLSAVTAPPNDASGAPTGSLSGAPTAPYNREDRDTPLTERKSLSRENDVNKPTSNDASTRAATMNDVNDAPRRLTPDECARVRQDDEERQRRISRGQGTFDETLDSAWAEPAAPPVERPPVDTSHLADGLDLGVPPTSQDGREDAVSDVLDTMERETAPNWDGEHSGA